MENPSGETAFWRKADSRRVMWMLFIGLAVGVMARWVSISAPPLPVQANEAHPPGAPAAIKIEGASPSARD